MYLLASMLPMEQCFIGVSFVASSSILIYLRWEELVVLEKV